MCQCIKDVVCTVGGRAGQIGWQWSVSRNSSRSTSPLFKENIFFHLLCIISNREKKRRGKKEITEKKNWNSFFFLFWIGFLPPSCSNPSVLYNISFAYIYIAWCTDVITQVVAVTLFSVLFIQPRSLSPVSSCLSFLFFFFFLFRMLCTLRSNRCLPLFFFFFLPLAAYIFPVLLRIRLSLVESGRFETYGIKTYYL